MWAIGGGRVDDRGLAQEKKSPDFTFLEVGIISLPLKSQ